MTCDSKKRINISLWRKSRKGFVTRGGEKCQRNRSHLKARSARSPAFAHTCGDTMQGSRQPMRCQNRNSTKSSDLLEDPEAVMPALASKLALGFSDPSRSTTEIVTAARPCCSLNSLHHNPHRFYSFGLAIAMSMHARHAGS